MENLIPEQNNPRDQFANLEENIADRQKKDWQGAVATIVILGLFAGPYFFSLLHKIFILGRYDATDIMSAVIIMIIAGGSVMAGLKKRDGTKKLLETMKNLSLTYKLVPEAYTPLADAYPPELAAFKGKFNNREIFVWPASDPSRRQNKNSVNVTVFATPVDAQWPAFIIAKKTFFGKIWGAMDYKDKYLILFTGKSAETKEQQLARTSTLLMDGALYDLDTLPGTNRIISRNGFFALIHDGFLYNAEEYINFMNTVTKVR